MSCSEELDAVSKREGRRVASQPEGENRSYMHNMLAIRPALELRVADEAELSMARFRCGLWLWAGGWDWGWSGLCGRVCVWRARGLAVAAEWGLRTAGEASREGEWGSDLAGLLFGAGPDVGRSEAALDGGFAMALGLGAARAPLYELSLWLLLLLLLLLLLSSWCEREAGASFGCWRCAGSVELRTINSGAQTRLGAELESCCGWRVASAESKATRCAALSFFENDNEE